MPPRASVARLPASGVARFQLQPGQDTAEDLMRRHGVAVVFCAESGRWLCGFHFAGPDVLASGRDIENAIDNFRSTIEAEQEFARLPASGKE